MPLKIKKKERESSTSLIRRFSKSVKKSGILLEARKRQFKKRSKSHEMKKKAALRREELKKKYKKLKKLGLLQK